MSSFRHNAFGSCRACGATHARPGAFGLCGDCLDCAERLSDGAITKNDVAAFLVKRLSSSIKRVSRGLPAVRCEAFTAYANNPARNDCQCASLAQVKKDGKWLCASHARLARPRYTPCEPVDQAKMIAGLVAQIAELEPNAKAEIKRVVNE